MMRKQIYHLLVFRLTFWCLVLLLVSAIFDRAEAYQFRAGCADVDISPRVLPALRNGGFFEQTASRVDDRLSAKCLALSDGTQTIVFAIVDSCMIPRDVCEAIDQLVANSAAIKPLHIVIAATHTHSAPSVMDFCLGTRKDVVYTEQLIRQVSQGIVQAIDDLRPARIGWTVVDAIQHTHCRRWLKHASAFGTDPFGEVTIRAMMHPGYQNAEYNGPAGPVDSQLSLINVQTSEGQPLCLLTNYAMHYFGADAGFSADYFGDFSEIMAAKIQPKSTASPSTKMLVIMSQGTSGDQHWMDYSQPQRVNYSRRQYAEELVQIALPAMETIDYRDDVKLAVAETQIVLSRRLPDAKRLAWAVNLNQQRGDRRPNSLPEVYAEQAVWLHENPTAELLLQAIQIGDLAIAAIPNEVFGITGLKLKAQSPFQPLVNFELANGAEGYIPPPEQFFLGGYTTWPARTAGLEVDAEPQIVASLLTLLAQLAGEKPRSLPLSDLYNDQQRQAIRKAVNDDNNQQNRAKPK